MCFFSAFPHLASQIAFTEAGEPVWARSLPWLAGLWSSRPLECLSCEHTVRCRPAVGKPRTACWIITSFSAEAAGGKMMSEWKSPWTSMWAEGTKTNTEKTGQYLNLFKGWSAQECLTIFCLVNRFHFLMAVLVTAKQNCRMESVFLPPPSCLLWLSGASPCSWDLRWPARLRRRPGLNSTLCSDFPHISPSRIALPKNIGTKSDHAGSNRRISHSVISYFPSCSALIEEHQSPDI